ncbi:MAG: CD20-like domain-containing protein [Promethearchaeota archaeon]
MVSIITGMIFIIFHDKGSLESGTALQAGIVFIITGIVILIANKKSFDYYKKRGNPVY